MENFILEGGKFTPEIRMDVREQHFYFGGECFPSSRRNFFVPVYDWVRDYLHSQKPENLTVVFELTFLDTASTQSFLRILQLLDDYRESHAAEIEVKWMYEEDDLDMLGVGKDYQEDVRLNIELIPVPPRDFDDDSA